MPLVDVPVNDLQVLANRKEYFKPSKKYYSNKYMTAEANYEGEFRKYYKDPVADQSEEVACVGEKLNYKGVNYRKGQPFIDQEKKTGRDDDNGTD